LVIRFFGHFTEPKTTLQEAPVFDNLFTLAGPTGSAFLLVATLFVITVVPMVGKATPRGSRLGVGAR
jgi:hypothetical protein